jgi:hypothetical protein
MLLSLLHFCLSRQVFGVLVQLFAEYLAHLVREDFGLGSRCDTLGELRLDMSPGIAHLEE